MDYRYSLNTDDIFLIDCRRPHWYSAVTDWTVAALHYQGPLAEYMVSQYETMGKLKHHENVFENYYQKLYDWNQRRELPRLKGVPPFQAG